MIVALGLVGAHAASPIAPASEGFAVMFSEPSSDSRDFTQPTLTVLFSAIFVCLGFMVLHSRHLLTRKCAELSRVREELASLRQRSEAQARRLAQTADSNRAPSAPPVGPPAVADNRAVAVHATSSGG